MKGIYMMRPMRLTAVLSCMFVAVIISGCLGPRQIVGPRTFVIKPEITTKKSQAPIQASVGIRPIEAPVQYDRKVVVLESDYRIVFKGQDNWAEQPASAITRVIIDAVAGCGHFSDVGSAYDMTRPDMIMTGELRVFCENRTVAPAVAEVEIRLELREVHTSKMFWSATMRETEPVLGEGSNTLAVAMNKAVGRLAERVSEELSATK